MSTTSTTGRSALVADKVESRVPCDRDGRARSPSAPPQGDDFNAEAQRRREAKPSRIAWLGDMPEGWKSRKIKYTFLERNQKNVPYEPLLAATQNHGVILKSEYENRTVEATKALDVLKLVEVGDFVISLRSFQGGIELSYRRGIISPAYTILIPTHVERCYFKYLAKSPSFISLLKSKVTGIREGQNIDYNKLRDELMPIPPVDEQRRMGAYLDETTGKIDKAIAAEERLIELLQERKQIIINEAVGGNLSHAEAQRRRGWEVRRLRHCFAKIFSGLWGMDPAADNGGIVCYRVADFDYARGGISKNKLTYRAYRSGEIAGRMVEKGDLLLEKSGGGDNSPVGRVVIVDKECEATCSNFIQALRCKDGYNSKFLCYVFCSLYSTKVNGYYYNQTTGIQNLKVAEYLSVEVPLPTLPEQEAIVKYLDEETGKIDRAIDVKRRQIALLRERREIIIDEVVTGKVKVA